jgi:hypothetical protein
VKNDYGTEYEARALNGLEKPLKKKGGGIDCYSIVDTVSLRVPIKQLGDFSIFTVCNSVRCRLFRL